MKNNNGTNMLIQAFGDQKRWLDWDMVNIGGKWTKKPRGSSTDPTTWKTYQNLLTGNKGIVFLPDQLLIGIDIDHCLVNGKISHPEAVTIEKLLNTADTYTEFSPSGEGLHLFLSVLEPLPLIANKKAPFEIYTSGRYFTVTSKPFGEPKKVRTITKEEAFSILGIIGYPWGKGETSKKIQDVENGRSFSDNKLLKKMFTAKNGVMVKDLYNGDISVYGNDDSSADMALCSHLAFWTGKDTAQIERLWLASPLGQREKTQQRQDYRTRTINNAVSECKETYTEKLKQPLVRVGIEGVKSMLQAIPPDIEAVMLPEMLKPLFEVLALEDTLTAENFICHNLKAHFGMRTKKEAEQYVTHFKKIRAALFLKVKTQVTNENLPIITNRDINFQEVYDAVSEVGIIGREIAQIVIAICLSAKLRFNPPLWLLIIGAPSTFKTEYVGLLGEEGTYTLDSMTENAFASGYVPPDGSEPQDLLALLDDTCFIIKDLNTLFSMNEEMVKKVLGDLTSIFDGKYQKFTATRGMIEYHALFSMIGCVTPSIMNKHHNYVNQLGPRFFFVRIPEMTDAEREKGYRIAWDPKNRKTGILKARQLVSSYVKQCSERINDYVCGPERENVKKWLNNAAEFIAKARGIAISKASSFENEQGKKIDFYEITDWQIEAPWRVLNQLKSLVKVIGFMNNHDEITQTDLDTLKPILVSTMQVDRGEVVKMLLKKCGLTAKDISKEIGKSSKTVRRTLKELEALKIVDAYKSPGMNLSGKAPWAYFVSEEFAALLDAPLPSAEFLSQSKSKSEEEKVETEEEDDF
jgi:predicted transcriptional regulator